MNLISHDAVKRVAILGSGTIGASWAAHFLAHGFAVNIWDPAPGFEIRSRRFISEAWPALHSLGAPNRVDESLIEFCADPSEAVRDSQFVQESGPENKDVKTNLYNCIDDSLPEGVVLASSSSGLSISELQTGLKGAPRYVIGHPFNPPHLVPLVEVVGGTDTISATVDWAMAFYNGCGKKAIRINREVPGHLVNRLQAAMWREAVHLVDSDVASVEDVDNAITYGPGLRWALMGPILIRHLAGGDGGLRQIIRHLGPSVESWWADLSNIPSITKEAEQKLIAGVEAEASGRSIEELARERDQLLVSLLKMLKRERSVSDKQ